MLRCFVVPFDGFILALFVATCNLYFVILHILVVFHKLYWLFLCIFPIYELCHLFFTHFIAVKFAFLQFVTVIHL